MKVQYMTVEATVKFKVLSNDDNIDQAVKDYCYLENDSDGEYDLFKDFQLLDWDIREYDKETIEIDDD